MPSQNLSPSRRRLSADELGAALAAEQVPQRKPEVAEARRVRATSWPRRERTHAQQRGNRRRSHSVANAVDRGEDHLAIRVDDEDRRPGDSAELTWIKDIPCLDEAAIGVAQDAKGQLKVAAETFRAFGAVDGDRDDVGSRRPNLFVVVAVVRQLTETKRSPVPAIEDQNDRLGRNELREPPGRAVGIGEFEVWGIAHRHRSTLEQERLGRRDRALELKQHALQRESATVAGQLAVRTDDAVTRDHNRNWIRTIRAADGARTIN